MSESEMKLQARLAALEYLVIHTMKTIYDMQNLTTEQLDAFDKQASELVRLQTIEGADPVKADMFLDEMGIHVLGMLKDARESYGK